MSAQKITSNIFCEYALAMKLENVLRIGISLRMNETYMDPAVL